MPADSPGISSPSSNRPGVRIASARRGAYRPWLERKLVHAKLMRSPGLAGSFELFVEQGLDALAGLRSALLTSAERMPGSRVLDGRFTAVQQAMGTPKGRDGAGFEYLSAFVEEAKASGLVAELIRKHEVVGLSVAPPASPRR